GVCLEGYHLPPVLFEGFLEHFSDAFVVIGGDVIEDSRFRCLQVFLGKTRNHPSLERVDETGTEDELFRCSGLGVEGRLRTRRPWGDEKYLGRFGDLRGRDCITGRVRPYYGQDLLLGDELLGGGG